VPSFGVQYGHGLPPNTSNCARGCSQVEAPIGKPQSGQTSHCLIDSGITTKATARTTPYHCVNLFTATSLKIL